MIKSDLISLEDKNKEKEYKHKGKIINNVIEQNKDFSITKFNEQVATTLACKLAIKANENITLKEMQVLIDDLRKCDNPYNCPHGRPTIVFYSKYDLEKLFKRRTLSRFNLENADFWQNVTLSYSDLNFYGICDALIISDTNIYPIEIKLHGQKPTKAQKMQLIAYGVLAEKIYKKIIYTLQSPIGKHWLHWLHGYTPLKPT